MMAWRSRRSHGLLAMPAAMSPRPYTGKSSGGAAGVFFLLGVPGGQDALVADDEQRRGDGPGPACRTACSHCFAHQLALATFNVKDFEDFAEHDGLQLIRPLVHVLGRRGLQASRCPRSSW